MAAVYVGIWLLSIVIFAFLRVVLMKLWPGSIYNKIVPGLIIGIGVGIVAKLDRTLFPGAYKTVKVSQDKAKDRALSQSRPRKKTLVKSTRKAR